MATDGLHTEIMPDRDSGYRVRLLETRRDGEVAQVGPGHFAWTEGHARLIGVAMIMGEQNLRAGTRKG